MGNNKKNFSCTIVIDPASYDPSLDKELVRLLAENIKPIAINTIKGDINYISINNDERDQQRD